MGRYVPASGCRDSGCADWFAHCHSSGRWGTRMDATLCVVFYGHRDFPDDCCDQIEVSQLGLGCLRWHDHAAARYFALGRLALVGILVPGIVRWNLVNVTRLVLCDAGVRYSWPGCAESDASS